MIITSMRKYPKITSMFSLGLLRLYSTTAMQNYWRWGQRKCLGEPPNAKFRIGDTKMLVSKNAKICVTPNAKHKICVTPNAKPQREPMQCRLRWVPIAKTSRWPCTFFFFCVDFIRVGSRFSVKYGLISSFYCL